MVFIFIVISIVVWLVFGVGASVVTVFLAFLMIVFGVVVVRFLVGVSGIVAALPLK